MYIQHMYIYILRMYLQYKIILKLQWIKQKIKKNKKINKYYKGVQYEIDAAS